MNADPDPKYCTGFICDRRKVNVPVHSVAPPCLASFSVVPVFSFFLLPISLKNVSTSISEEAIYLHLPALPARLHRQPLPQ
jgi:hypothetical protein